MKERGAGTRRIHLEGAGGWPEEPEESSSAPNEGTQEPVEQPHAAIRPPSPEDFASAPTPEAVQDTEDRFTDIELLGNSYQVRLKVNELGNKRTRAWESIKAKSANAWDMPDKIMKQALYNRAEDKMQKFETNHQAARNAVLEAGGSQRLVNHRLTRIDNKYNRKKAKWAPRRDQRKSSLDARVNQMTARTEAVKKNYERRNTAYVAELVKKKEEAFARKSLKHELRKNQGASLRETRAILKEIPAAQRKKIGETSLRARIAKEEATKTTETARQAKREVSRAEVLRGKNINKSIELANEAKNADATAKTIEEQQIPEQQTKTESLRAQLDTLGQDDPTREDILVQIQQSEERIKILKEREIPYWQSVAKKLREQEVTLLAERTALDRQIEKQIADASRHIEAADKQRVVADQYTTAHNEAINSALNPEERTEQ
ncbi:hypothetical protein EOL96_03535 [Candidatus Saccharibacteria bacterium]|nr:hypothetical protein [Candidatus Saccharibacteria bacterium]